MTEVFNSAPGDTL